MKLTLQLKIIALIILASASSLMATSAPSSFEFEWQDTGGGFTPTFLTVSVAFGQLTTISSANQLPTFEITTPNGVWTPSVFTPTGLTPTTSPFSITGYSGSVMVSGSPSAPTITFGQGGLDLDTTVAQGGHYDVSLATTSITGSTFINAAQGNFFRPADANNIDDGDWVSVPLGTTDAIPDAGNSLLLLVIAAVGLGLSHRFQRASV